MWGRSLDFPFSSQLPHAQPDRLNYTISAGHGVNREWWHLQIESLKFDAIRVSIRTLNSSTTRGFSVRNLNVRVRVVDMDSKLANKIPNMSWGMKSTVKNFLVFISSMAWSRKSPRRFDGSLSLSISVSLSNLNIFSRSWINRKVCYWMVIPEQWLPNMSKSQGSGTLPFTCMHLWNEVPGIFKGKEMKLFKIFV